MISGTQGQQARTHNWQIDEREYARHEQRRGRRFAYGLCVPARTCLVIVDMVDFFVQQSPTAAGIVDPVNRGAATLRRAGGIVAWVVPTTEKPSRWQIDFYGTEVADLYAASGGGGEPRKRIASALHVDEADLVVEKSSPSAFFGPGAELHQALQDRRIDRVLIAGTTTSVCCESSARDAATLGYQVVVLGDATADVSDAAHNASLRTMYRSFGDVRSVDDALRVN